MRSLRPFLAPLLVALSATAPTLARADASQPAPPATSPDGPTRPWIDETDAARPSDNEGKPARPATGEGTPAAPTGAQKEATPSGDEGKRPTAEGRGSARSTAEAGGRARSAAGGSEAIGFSTAEGELATTQAAAVAAARRAKARFGHKGQFILDEVIGFRTGNDGMGIVALGPSGLVSVPLGGGGPFTGIFMASTSSLSTDTIRSKFSSVGVSPSVDYFLADGLSIGGSLSFTYSRIKSEQMWDEPGQLGTLYKSDQHVYGVGIEPRIGAVLPLTEALSLWPRLGVGYQGSGVRDGSGGVLSRHDTFSAFTRLGLVVTAGRHLFFDLGPELRVSHTANDPNSAPEFKSTAAGLSVSGGLGLAF